MLQNSILYVVGLVTGARGHADCILLWELSRLQQHPAYCHRLGIRSHVLVVVKHCTTWSMLSRTKWLKDQKFNYW